MIKPTIIRKKLKEKNPTKYPAYPKIGKTNNIL